MEMTGEYRIPAPRQVVWDALTDPSAPIAPVTISGQVAPQSLTLTLADGTGIGVALVEDGDETILGYTGLGEAVSVGRVAAFFDAFAVRFGGESTLDEVMPIAPTHVPKVDELVEEVEQAAEQAEERLEVAAGKGFLGGPIAWGFIAVAVLIVLLAIFR